MKKSILLAALGVAAFGAVRAQEVGSVISSTPVIQQVAVPRQVCSNQPVVVQQRPPAAAACWAPSPAAPSATRSATARGRARPPWARALSAGALVGNSIEAGASSYAQHVPQCTTQTSLREPHGGATT